MQIKQSVLDEVKARFIDPHGLLTLDGIYDGLVGELTMTFEDDENVYVEEFGYSGQEIRNFYEVLYVAVGKAVKKHNIYLGIPNRDAFIAEVTE